MGLAAAIPKTNVQQDRFRDRTALSRRRSAVLSLKHTCASVGACSLGALKQYLKVLYPQIQDTLVQLQAVVVPFKTPLVCVTYPGITMQSRDPGPNPVDRNGLCLLSLDGGGVRGLSSLYILECIMSLVNAERLNTPPLKPCEIFDLIGGTSTGGYV